MNKNSTPLLEQIDKNDPTVKEIAPSKRVVDFVRQFARSCRVVAPGRPHLQTMVLN